MADIVLVPETRDSAGSESIYLGRSSIDSKVSYVAYIHIHTYIHTYIGTYIHTNSVHQVQFPVSTFQFPPLDGKWARGKGGFDVRAPDVFNLPSFI